MSEKSSSEKIRLGIDLGGTKIEIIALDGNGAIRARRRVSTPRHDYDASLNAMADLVRAVESELGCQEEASVGIAMPGTLSPATGLVKNANSTWLNDTRLDRDLEERLGRNIRFANDANCFALSEATDGAAAGASCVFGVIIGTGVGGGIVVNGRILAGPNSIAGEWGHNPIPWPQPDELPGPACYCGLNGCIETWLSGPGLAADYQRHEGQEMNGPAIVTAAEQGDGDSGALAALQRYENRLTRALAHLINILDPDVIVLGGGLSNVQRWYDNIPKMWRQYVFSDHVATRLVAPVHGDSSGVRGAAWLWE